MTLKSTVGELKQVGRDWYLLGKTMKTEDWTTNGRKIDL